MSREMTAFGRLLREVMLDPGDPAAALALADAYRDWTADELDVLGYLADRLALGRDRYGPLDIDQDGRDWGIEQAEEHEDAVVYAGAKNALRLRKASARHGLSIVRPGA